MKQFINNYYQSFLFLLHKLMKKVADWYKLYVAWIRVSSLLDYKAIFDGNDKKISTCNTFIN